jgi:putative flippase GtrA
MANQQLRESASLSAQNDARTMRRFLAAGGVGIQLTGTWAGTVTFEATVDGSTWVTVAAVPAAGGASVTSATANGVWTVENKGFSGVRARFSTATSGTVVATLLQLPNA